VSLICSANMDRKTFEALQTIVNFAENAIGTGDVHPDAHYKAFEQVKGWMNEVHKEIDDVETLGTENRPPLAPIK
jgi:hypothetical protein